AAGLWVRVPVIPGDLDRLDVAAAVAVSRLGGEGERFTATPIEAPPSADPVAATVDLFYALDPAAPLRRPGERVLATLTYAGDEPLLEVPRSAVVLDADGGAWVYGCDEAPLFRRIRVEVALGGDDRVRLRRGPPEGACVVAVGAVELLGAEFGVKH
ncbi:MAG: hypothetical protein KC486_35005, partial [Myxococcales bacterium]|nr:hypothetical protein [Myxococcales bacterium]